MISSSRTRYAIPSSIARIAIYFVTSVITLGIAPNAGSQQSTRSNDPAVIHNRFQSAIDALAAKWHIAIVTESSPIMQNAGEDLSASRLNETVEQAVARVGAAFDYSMKRKGNVFLLNKMFTDTEDLPDVTLGEVTTAMDEINGMLAPFKPKYPEAPAPGSEPAVSMAGVLSPEQLSFLDHGGLAVASLAPQQRDEVWKLAMWFYLYEPSELSESTAQHLHALASLDPVFRWDLVGDQPEFGADELSDAPPKVEFQPISHPDTFGGFAKAPDGTKYPVRITVGPPDSGPPPDPSEPSASPADAIEGDAALSNTHTIRGVLTRLNNRDGGSTRHTVDRELGDKTVFDAGLDNVSSDQIASAVAEIYGLELRHKPDGSVNVSRPQAITVSGISDLNRALTAAVPGPMLRCLLARTGELKALKSAGHPRASHFSNVFMDAGGVVKIAAVRKVRSAAQPMALKTSDKRIALSKLPLSSVKAFAVSESVMAFASAMRAAQSKVPAYVADFDRVVLTGSRNGQSYISVQLSIKDPDTGDIIKGPSTSYGSP